MLTYSVRASGDLADYGLDGSFLSDEQREFVARRKD